MSQTKELGVKSASDEFACQAENARHSLFGEFLYFLAHNKKWWLLPILICLLLVGTLLILSTSVLAPLIYPLF